MAKEHKGILSKGIFLGREEGFTIIELMVAAALSLVVMGGIYSVYRSQQESYIVREQETAMQQNIRAGMVIMTSDIRMAGYHHPTVDVSPGITSANPTSIAFTMLKNKGDRPDPTDTTLETITYSLDGKNLKRTINDGSTTSDQIIAENIDWVDFVYLNSAGAVIANPPASLTEIKSIQVTLIARAGKADPDYSDAEVHPDYYNQQDVSIYSPVADDNFRRRRLSREIKCRNL